MKTILKQALAGVLIAAIAVLLALVVFQDVIARQLYK
jgi:hypothetical protein